MNNVSVSLLENAPDGNGGTCTLTMVTDAKGNTLTYAQHHWCYVGHASYQAKIVSGNSTTYYNSPALGMAAFNKL